MQEFKIIVPFDIPNRHGFINPTRLEIKINQGKTEKYKLTILVLLSMLIIQVGQVCGTHGIRDYNVGKRGSF